MVDLKDGSHNALSFFDASVEHVSTDSCMKVQSKLTKIISFAQRNWECNANLLESRNKAIKAHAPAWRQNTAKDVRSSLQGLRAKFIDLNSNELAADFRHPVPRCIPLPRCVEGKTQCTKIAESPVDFIFFSTGNSSRCASCSPPALTPPVMPSPVTATTAIILPPVAVG